MSLGQNSLNNFYTSVKYANPSLAARMADDVIAVALLANTDDVDKAAGQDAADRLRHRTLESTLPESLQSVLETAITQLGYS